MKTIQIAANQFKIFGRAERYFLENPVENFSETDVILKGFFETDCFSLLIDYLKNHQLRFHSLTFSNDLIYLPSCQDFLPSEILIIPEGIETINNFTFINLNIKSLALPQTLTKIDDKAFVNCQIQEILLPDNNQTFILKDGVIKNSLTKQIILKTNKAALKDLEKWNNNNQIWHNFAKINNLPVTNAVYWKKYFEQIKNQLTAKKLLVSVNTNLDAKTQLKMLLQVLPDSFGNLYKLPARDIESNLFPYLISLQYLTEGCQKRKYPDQNTCFNSFFDPVSSVYCYNSTLLSPESIPVLFNHINQGFEMIIPKLQLLLFFSEDELNLIPAFLLKLQENLPQILEELLYEKDDFILSDYTLFYSEKNQSAKAQISQQSRQNVLSALTKINPSADEKKTV